MDREHKRIIIILTAIIFAFMILIVYLTYFQIFKADIVKNNNYNKRQWISEEKILRGSILDRNGVKLAYSIKDEDSELSRRVYDYKNLYSHIIGYSYREYGKTGLELKYNDSLLGIESNSAITDIKNMMEAEKVGNDIKTTLDHELQKKSREELNGKKGAVITMNPKTGEIYAMVSFPDFDASNLREDWKNISENPDSPLLNRASQGLYEPGSTFKLVTASAILNNGLDEAYICKGKTLIDGYTFKDYKSIAHGNVDLNRALVKSCNSYFVEKAVELGKNNFGKTVDSFYINREIPFEINTAKSKFDYKKDIGKTELAASGIGQGKVLISPLNMAIITSGIVNDGIMVKPTLIKEILDKEGNILEFNQGEELGKVLSREDSQYLREIMGNVVNSGTGSRAKISGVNVGGKTGTAETGRGTTHAWFLGFAPVEDPSIVTVVVLEDSTSNGGIVAAPIAKNIMEYAIKTLGY